MNPEDLLTQKLNKTIVNGRLDEELIEGLENIETVDEAAVSAEAPEPQDVNLEIESIISKLNEGDAGLELNRYETASLLESANNDEFVLMVKDNDLDRIVEAHVLNQDRVSDSEQHSELIHEALILSGLDHPGIPPIYDLNIASNQWVYCTLKHIEGFSLSRLCVRHAEDVDQQIIVHDTVAEIVANFIKIAEIIKYAHKAQVIHRNIKPDNLIIDNFGQIYVTAWGNAIDLERDKPDFHILRGTPLYMSPEQAACGALDARSDIYSLGACLFHVLFKRPHAIREDLDEFLLARKGAAIDDLSEFEGSETAAPLLAVCKRCLAPLEERYQEIDAFIADLKTYQEDQIIEEYKDGSQQAQGKLAVPRQLKWLVPALLVMLAICWYAYQAYAKQYAAWGAAIYAENFDDDSSWASDWALVKGSYSISPEEKRVVTKDGPAFIWFYKQRLNGGVAIEFEGEMLPGAAPGDLSIVYATDPDDRLLEGKGPGGIYYLQHAAVGNVCSMIEGPSGRLDYTNQSLQNGVRYKIRGEIEGKQLKLYLDDVLVCTYELLFPLSSGYIGLYAYYDGKAIDNIKIYNRELPKVTNIVKTGDLLYEHDQYKPALERYRRIARLHEGTELGNEGLYKTGLCYYHMGEVDRAFEVWKPLEQSQYFAQINFYRWKELEKKSDYNALLRQMYSFYRSADDRLRVQIREQWGIFLRQVRRLGYKELTREFLRFRDSSFPDDQIFSDETSIALRLLEMPNRSLELFPDQPVVVTRALAEMGEYQKILKNYPHMRSAVAGSLRNMGQNQRILDEFSDLRGVYFAVLMELGLFDRAEKEFAGQDEFMAKILFNKGDYDAIIDTYPNTVWSERAAVIRDRDPQRHIDANPSEAFRSAVGYDARTSLLLKRFIDGDESAIVEMYDNAASVNYYESIDASIKFHLDLLPDILAHFNGNPEALQRNLREIWEERRQILGLRHWHNVGLLLGELDKDAYLAQPSQPNVLSDYYFYEAIHQDIVGDKAAALSLYRAYAELPLHKKRFHTSLIYKQFVEYRMKALQ